MNGPEHYREAERLLAHANATFLDTSDDPAPRAEYASEAAYVEALEISNDLHREAMRTAAWTTAQAQVHATLALAAATALNDAQDGMDPHSFQAWRATAGRRADPTKAARMQDAANTLAEARHG
ncbi:hypothetical protein [Streptomyces anulatus]|uniref:hypothetical protein n=1 Tax=Streptomyces anulatus TaxID=1892 RepID=UPI001D17DF6E|nr:hypothetical protein [Streptomyces anulatus]